MPSGDGLTSEHPLPCPLSHPYAYCPTLSARCTVLTGRVSGRVVPPVLIPFAPLLQPLASTVQVGQCQQISHAGLYQARLRVYLRIRRCSFVRAHTATCQRFAACLTWSVLSPRRYSEHQPHATFRALRNPRPYRMQGSRLSPGYPVVATCSPYTLDPGATPNRTQSLPQPCSLVKPLPTRSAPYGNTGRTYPPGFAACSAE
jgi:hypothetical protein